MGNREHGGIQAPAGRDRPGRDTPDGYGQNRQTGTQRRCCRSCGASTVGSAGSTSRRTDADPGRQQRESIRDRVRERAPRSFVERRIRLLYTIAGLEEPHGLAIKEELEEYYEKEILTGDCIRISIRLSTKTSSKKANSTGERTITRLQTAAKKLSRPPGVGITVSRVRSFSPETVDPLTSRKERPEKQNHRHDGSRRGPERWPGCHHRNLHHCRSRWPTPDQCVSKMPAIAAAVPIRKRPSDRRSSSMSVPVE